MRLKQRTSQSSPRTRTELKPRLRSAELAPRSEDERPDEEGAPPPRSATGLYEKHGKRALDLLFLAAVAPLAVVIATPIALWNAVVFRDLRQVFFLQRRIGHQGRIFWIYKFRTMREARASEQGAWSIEKDVQRTTRFGRFLRNTHLDELPQLINIAKGDMHIVGPRPEMVEVHRWACTEVPGFAQRLATPPGLTGLAQITQGYTVREAECYAQKLSIDLDYIARTSLRMDVSILLRTIPWILAGRGWSWQRFQRGRITTTPKRQSTNGAAPNDATGS